MLCHLFRHESTVLIIALGGTWLAAHKSVDSFIQILEPMRYTGTRRQTEHIASGMMYSTALKSDTHKARSILWRHASTKQLFPRSSYFASGVMFPSLSIKMHQACCQACRHESKDVTQCFQRDITITPQNQCSRSKLYTLRA